MVKWYRTMFNHTSKNIWSTLHCIYNLYIIYFMPDKIFGVKWFNDPSFLRRHPFNLFLGVGFPRAPFLFPFSCPLRLLLFFHSLFFISLSLCGFLSANAHFLSHSPTSHVHTSFLVVSRRYLLSLMLKSQDKWTVLFHILFYIIEQFRKLQGSSSAIQLIYFITI